MKFWVRANQAVAELGQSLGPDQYMQVNFDLLCQNPKLVIDELIAFLSLDIDEIRYLTALELPKTPPSQGRYKKHDLSQFDSNDLDVVKSFGFTVK